MLLDFLFQEDSIKKHSQYLLKKVSVANPNVIGRKEEENSVGDEAQQGFELVV